MGLFTCSNGYDIHNDVLSLDQNGCESVVYHKKRMCKSFFQNIEIFHPTDP